jgi:hypothetical protein
MMRTDIQKSRNGSGIDGSGPSAVVGGCALAATLLCMVRFGCASCPFLGDNFPMDANCVSEIKLVIVAVYSNFRTHIVDDEGIQQLDGYTCGPASNKLILRFEKV